MCGRVSAGFFRCDILFLQGKAKCATYSKNSLYAHLQQYDKNHCVYLLTRIGHHSEKKAGET